MRPILTYAAKTRTDTNWTERALRTTEMRALRAIAGVTLRSGRKVMRSGRDAMGCRMLLDGHGEEEGSEESMSTGWETIDSPKPHARRNQTPSDP